MILFNYCLALSAVMLAGSLSGCSGGTSGLPGDTSKASEAPAGKEAEGTKGESAAGEAGEKPYAGTTIRVLSMTGQISDAIEAYLDDFEEECVNGGGACQKFRGYRRVLFR